MTLTEQFVTPADRPTVNFLLYGPAKSGKSLGAASAPGKVLYMNADLPTATFLVHRLYGDKILEIGVTGLSTLVEVSQEIAAHAEDWGTVVLDTAGDTYRRVIETMSGRALSPKIDQYRDTGTHIERFCRFMCEAPVNFVVCAHETAQRDEETGAFERLPLTGTNNPALGAKLMAMVDVFGYTAVVPQEDGSARYMAQLVDGKGRRGGDRFKCLGSHREVDLSEWLSVIESSVAVPVAAAA